MSIGMLCLYLSVQLTCNRIVIAGWLPAYVVMNHNRGMKVIASHLCLLTAHNMHTKTPHSCVTLIVLDGDYIIMLSLWRRFAKKRMVQQVRSQLAVTAATVTQINKSKKGHEVIKIKMVYYPNQSWCVNSIFSQLICNFLVQFIKMERIRSHEGATLILWSVSWFPIPSSFHGFILAFKDDLVYPWTLPLPWPCLFVRFSHVTFPVLLLFSDLLVSVVTLHFFLSLLAWFQLLLCVPVPCCVISGFLLILCSCLLCALCWATSPVLLCFA